MTQTPAAAQPDKGRPVPDIRTELPGPCARQVLERDRAVTSGSLPRAYPLVPCRGWGAVIEDADGNLFLDCNAGIAVAATGHAHPRVVAAIRQQATELLHYSASDFYLPIYSQMCEALAATAPMPGPIRVFLTNSGAEAVEGALKLVRYVTGRPYVISFFGSFHGRSYGAMTLTASKAQYHDGFGPLVPGVLHAPYAFSRRDPGTGVRTHDPEETFDYLENILFRCEVPPSEVGAIFVEPILGEGGYIVPPSEWLVRLRELCDRHSILLVADEVQSGMGRSGRLWSIEHSGVRPDLLLSAKGIASGLPLGAIMAPAELMERWAAGAHGSTFGGSPVPCAAGLATLEVIRSERLLANATAQGTYLQDGLRALWREYPETITGVRGLGLMIGVELRTSAIADLVQFHSFESGLLVLGCGESSVRLSPPLVITREEAQTALKIFAGVVHGVSQ